jgi:thiol-disulfide isomerase/thioredoxin
MRIDASGKQGVTPESMMNPRSFRGALMAFCLILVPHADATDALADLDGILQLREERRQDELVFACESFLQAHPSSPVDATVRFYLAKALHDGRKYVDSIDSVDEMLRRHPGHGLLEAAVMLKGESLRLLKKHEESIPVFRLARELAHRHKGANAAHAHYHIIQALHELKRTDEARTELEVLKKDYPSSSYVRSATSALDRPVAQASRPPETGPAEGAEAPDIEFVLLEDGRRRRLSDFKGKVVVLEFWASWCGPCQAPMAKMQTYREKHPEWGNRVELLTVSIDNTKDKASDHLRAKGWDKTLNAWGGDGGFRSPPPVAYGVRGIPSMFIIDAAGKVAHKGHPMRLDTPKLVDDLLGRN